MHSLLSGLLFFALAFPFPASAETAVHHAASEPECVILLHGLARSAKSMRAMEQQINAAGYRVVNVDYPSRSATVEVLAATYLPQAIAACEPAATIHFVTHSMGGILLRYWLSIDTVPGLGRVVMLGPPNHGSELVDKLQGVPGYSWLNGPAGYQLGTTPESLPQTLGAATFELGIIAGSFSFNPVYSSMIPGDDDGKVSVTSAKLAGMQDFVVLKRSHSWMMRADDVIYQTLYFLRHGLFDPAAEGKD